MSRSRIVKELLLAAVGLPPIFLVVSCRLDRAAELAHVEGLAAGRPVGHLRRIEFAHSDDGPVWFVIDDPVALAYLEAGRLPKGGETRAGQTRSASSFLVTLVFEDGVKTRASFSHFDFRGPADSTDDAGSIWLRHPIDPNSFADPDLYVFPIGRPVPRPLADALARFHEAANRPAG